MKIANFLKINLIIKEIYYGIFLLFFLFIRLIITKHEYYNSLKNNKTITHNKKLYYPYYTYLPSKVSTIKYPLIWGFAVGYSWKKICLFILSLRNNQYKGDLVLAISLMNYKIFLNEFKNFHIKPILLEDEWPFYSSKNELFSLNYTFLESCIIEYRRYTFKWNIYRFSIMYCWLLVYGKKYSHIMSLDVRDVVFQGNPFKWNFEDGLYIADENKRNNYLIKDNRCNLNWIKCYKNYTKIINNKILNVGTILGTVNYFFPFIMQFCQFLKDNYVNTAEQGTFIYTYYTGYFKNINFLMNKNQKGVVLTTGIDLLEVKKLKIINQTIYNDDGTIPLIIHQYDRYKILTSIYKQKYC